MSTPALDLSDLRVRYRGSMAGRPSEILALDGVSLVVATGECVGVAGPRGAGKTTLLLCAAGILNPDSGVVRAARAEYVARGTGAQPFLSVAASLEFAASMRELSGLEPGPSPGHVIERAGLAAWSRVRLGELPPARRACAQVAHALLAEPALLCVDDLAADAGVDASREFAALLASLCADGIAVLLSARDAGPLEGVATRVLELDGGRIAAAAGVSTLELDVALPRHAAAILSNRVPSVRRRGRALCVALDRISPEEVLSACVALGISVYGSRVVAASSAGRVAEGTD